MTLENLHNLEKIGQLKSHVTGAVQGSWRIMNCKMRLRPNFPNYEKEL